MIDMTAGACRPFTSGVRVVSPPKSAHPVSAARPMRPREKSASHPSSRRGSPIERKKARGVAPAAEIVAKAPIAEQALPYCNITCITGEDMKEALSGYLEVLYEQAPESVGGSLPDDAFYYIP